MSKHKKHKNPNQDTNINEVSNDIITEEEIDELDDEMEDETEDEVNDDSKVIEETVEESIKVSEMSEMNINVPDSIPVESKIEQEEIVEVTESYYTVATGLKLGKFIDKCGNFVTRDQAIKKANSTTIETGVIHHVYDPTGKIIFTAKNKLTLFAKKKRGAYYVNRNLK